MLILVSHWKGIQCILFKISENLYYSRTIYSRTLRNINEITLHPYPGLNIMQNFAHIVYFILQKIYISVFFEAYLNLFKRTEIEFLWMDNFNLFFKKFLQYVQMFLNSMRMSIELFNRIVDLYIDPELNSNCLLIYLIDNLDYIDFNWEFLRRYLITVLNNFSTKKFWNRSHLTSNNTFPLVETDFGSYA
jgi:hypothetical protein